MSRPGTRGRSRPLRRADKGTLSVEYVLLLDTLRKGGGRWRELEAVVVDAECAAGTSLAREGRMGLPQHLTYP
jgi:hypothetical protein